ncbi:MAG: aminotransferase class V-fold PLP-dependent enzyme, partial [Calditrichaeota bacterium]
MSRNSIEKKVYLDYNATTPVDPDVLETMLPFFKEHYGNPSSLHQWGRKAREAVEQARVIVADALNARESEIYFVSGGTEADNLVIQGVMFQNRQKGNH